MIPCTLCAKGKKDIEAAGGTVIAWPCNHRPHIILSTPFNIETCTLAWEKAVDLGPF